MPRGKALDRMSIRELQNLIHTRKSRLTRLRRERAKVLVELNRIEREIAKTAGPGGGRALRLGGGNAKSLVQTMKEILARAGKPMPVKQIFKAVEATGYQSTSANFRAIVNQTLIKERKHFVHAARGTYALKK